MSKKSVDESEQRGREASWAARQAVRADLVPTEEQEQRALADYLDWQRVTWCHVPNGGQRSKAVAGKLRAAGVKAGVPDVLIFDRAACDCVMAGHDAGAGIRHEPSCAHLARGIAVELKRQRAKGHAAGRVSPEQAGWHARLVERGWIVLVCHGAGDAITRLEALGLRFNRGDG